jgi:hypothetical protein
MPNAAIGLNKHTVVIGLSFPLSATLNFLKYGIVLAYAPLLCQLPKLETNWYIMYHTAKIMSSGNYIYS